ncbi:MAG: PSD1 domain-containing protein [Planctomycetaceae bacterium]|nr:PSD1 domain-containing protein [Planctomycetaceae bacterium]
MTRTSVCIAAFCLASLLGSANIASAQAVDFERDVAPVLIMRCLECHRGKTPSGNLLLESGEGFARGGDSGAAVDVEHPEKSYLLERVHAVEMPPPSRGKPQPLAAAEIDVLTRWIQQGAKWPNERKLDLYEKSNHVRAGRDWWSLQPVVRPEVPQTKGQGKLHPVDAFIRRRLQKTAFEPAPRASREVLIRRLYDDILGLPPNFDEIDWFVESQDAHAWEELVDGVLGSPHYGERWARHWLDVVRFAETSGYERDQTKPFAWKYRDWVIDALNNDLPYDEFIIQQLAGDELPERTNDNLIATGFLRLGTWNDEPNDPEDYKYDRLEDLVHSTSSAFLGLTVKCARCHDHKFDPIPQDDYYRMAAIFWPGAIAARDRKFLGGPSDEELQASEVLAWTDITTEPPPLHVLKNGERHNPRYEIVPATLSFLPETFEEFATPAEQATGTQRRLHMARWIADKRNPLTSRVIVNRIWQHHFGEGIVRSPNNFGFTGDAPTHPELLDWLAAELMDHNWSLKHIHKLILTSETYQQSVDHSRFDEYAAVDSTNRLWWRANRRRRDAESLRDALLDSTGELDVRQGGPSFVPTVSKEALEGLSRRDAAWSPSPPEEQKRRSIYTFIQRSLLPPLMTTFDLCDSTLPCGQRNVTTVAPQALSMLNNQFIHDRAEALAETTCENEETDEQRVQAIWRATLRRNPHPWEVKAAMQHVREQSKRFAELKENPQPVESPPVDTKQGLVLSLDASKGVEQDDSGRVIRWLDQSGQGHHAEQMQSEHRPSIKPRGVGDVPSLHFDGAAKFLSVAGSLLEQPECTMIAVVSDEGPTGHREILSNWNREQNVGTSVFLGLTAENQVRWSDDFANAGGIEERNRPFVICATNGPDGAYVFQNLAQIGARSTSLSARKLDTPWVIGQQGNIQGEYWHGHIAALKVYNRPLNDAERTAVCADLMQRYQISDAIPYQENEVAARSPEVLAWASLCVVLFNSNEFIYVD